VQLARDSEEQNFRKERVPHMHKFRTKFDENFSVPSSSNI